MSVVSPPDLAPPAGFEPFYRKSSLTDPWEPIYCRRSPEKVVLEEEQLELQRAIAPQNPGVLQKKHRLEFMRWQSRFYEEARKLALAQTIGTLSLVLRKPGENQDQTFVETVSLEDLRSGRAASLGVELHSLDRPVAVAQCHDDAARSATGDGELGGDRGHVRSGDGDDAGRSLRTCHRGGASRRALPR